MPFSKFIVISTGDGLDCSAANIRRVCRDIPEVFIVRRCGQNQRHRIGVRNSQGIVRQCHFAAGGAPAKPGFELQNVDFYFSCSSVLTIPEASAQSEGVIDGQCLKIRMEAVEFRAKGQFTRPAAS